MQTAEIENGTQVQHFTRITDLLNRADALYQEGYWLQVKSETAVLMHKQPTKAGRYAPIYTVNLEAWTCNCRSFTGPRADGFFLLDGRRTCKHLEGFFGLAAAIGRDKLALYEETAGKLNGTAGDFARRMIHMGCKLEIAYGFSTENREADNAKKVADALSVMIRTFKSRERKLREAAREAQGRRAAA